MPDEVSRIQMALPPKNALPSAIGGASILHMVMQIELPRLIDDTGDGLINRSDGVQARGDDGNCWKIHFFKKTC
jgi:hypothetical protein